MGCTFCYSKNYLNSLNKEEIDSNNIESDFANYFNNIEKTSNNLSTNVVTHTKNGNSIVLCNPSLVSLREINSNNDYLTHDLYNNNNNNNFNDKSNKLNSQPTQKKIKHLNLVKSNTFNKNNPIDISSKLENITDNKLKEKIDEERKSNLEYSNNFNLNNEDNSNNNLNIADSGDLENVNKCILNNLII
jgi:hypothetical protein